MFGQCLVTPTLLDSFEFAANAPASWKNTAKKDLLAKIRREEIKYPDWVTWGMEFENKVYEVCRNLNNEEEINNLQSSDHFKDVVKSCYGGQFQQKLKRNMQIDEDKVFLFGFSDVEFTDYTLDIKTTMNYKGPQKYLTKAQHLMYLYMNGKSKFEYLVVEWKAGKEKEINNVYSIHYSNDDQNDLENQIIAKIRSLFKYLRDNNLWNDYYLTFSKN